MGSQVKEPPLSPEEVAESLGVSRDTVYGWLRDGFSGPRGKVKLGHRRAGWKYVIRPEDVEAFERACRGEEAPAPNPARTAGKARARKAEAALAEALKGRRKR